MWFWISLIAVVLVLLLAFAIDVHSFKLSFGFSPFMNKDGQEALALGHLRDLGDRIGELAISEHRRQFAKMKPEAWMTDPPILNPATLTHEAKEEWAKAKILLKRYRPGIAAKAPHWSEDPQGVYAPWRKTALEEKAPGKGPQMVR